MPQIHEKIDMTAEVFIVFRQRVLLRMHDKYKIWLGVGGHIELNEDPNEAAIREVKEEVGLTVELIGHRPSLGQEEPGYRQLIAPAYMDRHKISETHEHVRLRYFATSETEQVSPNYQGDRSNEWKWFTVEELDDPLFAIRSSIKYYAHAALKAVTE